MSVLRRISICVKTHKEYAVARGRIAQLVEQLTLNQRVPGSNPGAPTTALSAKVRKRSKKEKNYHANNASQVLCALGHC